MQFIKFHGFGNDYIVFESKELADGVSLNDFARRICNRHYGAGADGIAVVTPSGEAGADFRVRIFNPDGSEANLSGNGTRCAAAYLFYQKLWSRDELRLTTRAGIKLYHLREKIGDGTYWFDSELGQPGFESATIPMLTEGPRERVINYPLEVEGEMIQLTAIQIGNPVCCIFVDDFAELNWRCVGRALETDKHFPERTNVTFVRVLSRDSIEIRIWERGVGETTASGSCSCAAAVAAMINDKTDRRVEVLMEGGRAEIVWREDGEVVLTGRADIVYSGTWLAV